MKREVKFHDGGAWSVRVEVGTVYGSRGIHVGGARAGCVFPPTTENIRDAMRRCVRALRIVFERPAKKK